MIVQIAIMTERHEIAQPVKDELQEIYQAFAEVCSRHCLRHWVAWGTMLGAVRHHGFIPWDDDLDVFMLRDDYESFVSIADAELPAHFKQVTYRNCKDYPATFGKIQESRINVYERIRDKCGYVNPHGLYIDIFPLDGCPDGWLSSKVDTFRQASLFCLSSHIFRSGRHSTLKGRFSDLFGTVLSPFYGNPKTKNDLAYCADCIYKDYPVSGGSRVRIGNYESRFQKREIIMPRNAFDETIILPFENISAPVPKGYDACLTAIYGKDYMTPPPLEKRVSEHSKQDAAPWIYGP